MSVPVPVSGVVGSVVPGFGVGTSGSVEGYVQALPSQVPPLFIHVSSAFLVSSSVSSSVLHVPASSSHSPPAASQASFSFASAVLQVPVSSSH